MRSGNSRVGAQSPICIIPLSFGQEEAAVDQGLGDTLLFLHDEESGQSRPQLVT